LIRSTQKTSPGGDDAAGALMLPRARPRIHDDAREAEHGRSASRPAARLNPACADSSGTGSWSRTDGSPTNRGRRRDLIESQAKYRLLVENTADLIVKTDPEGRLTFVSPSYCRVFGKTESALIGCQHLSPVHGDDRTAAMAAIAKLNSPPHTAYVEQRALTKDGWRWLAWSDTAVIDGQGRIREVIGVGRDITERKDLEARLLQSQKLQAVGQLAGGIAHDFNNILHSMLGSLAMIRDDLPSGSASPPFLEHIQASADRAASLTRQLLAFGRRQTIDRRPWPPHILADPTHVEQVLLNLCVNARDAIDGIGLGLATVFGIVSQHDGTIECDSVPGRGTVFTIRLPATTATVVPVDAQPAAPATCHCCS
jgi:PAS domain S-box-containing protein